MPSAPCFKLDQSNILLCDNKLNYTDTMIMYWTCAWCDFQLSTTTLFKNYLSLNMGDF